MMETKQFSVWAMPADGEQKKSGNNDTDEDERKQNRSKRYRAAYDNLKCCCCSCSTPILAGVLIGALIAGIGLAIALTMYLDTSHKTTSTILTTTVTFRTATTVTTTSSTASTSTTSTQTTSTTTSTTTTAPYCTTRVTFDDIPGQSATSGIIPNGYNNLNWTNVFYLNASTMPNSGYQTVLSSPSYVAYNPGGFMIEITTANGTRFAFNSIVVAPAWRDNLTWSIFGYRGGVGLLGAGFSLYELNQTRLTCGACSNWDTIYMTVSGGTPHTGLAQSGTEFAFDDLCISFGY